MRIGIYPKIMLEITWQNDKQKFSSDAKQIPHCLRCGNPLHKELAANSLSRFVNVYICSCCGMDEALGHPLPLQNWHAVINGHMLPCSQDSTTILTPICSFEHAFHEQRKKTTGATRRPASEFVYSRSDYDGYRWWTTWFNCNTEKKTPQLIEEIDLFSTTCFQMPEFKNLSSMVSLCHQYAQATSSDTEFNLYTETEHFYIWLRLITRFRDYNLYTHFYLK